METETHQSTTESTCNMSGPSPDIDIISLNSNDPFKDQEESSDNDSFSGSGSIVDNTIDLNNDGPEVHINTTGSYINGGTRLGKKSVRFNKDDAILNGEEFQRTQEERQIMVQSLTKDVATKLTGLFDTHSNCSTSNEEKSGTLENHEDLDDENTENLQKLEMDSPNVTLSDDTVSPNKRKIDALTQDDNKSTHGEDSLKRTPSTHKNKKLAEAEEEEHLKDMMIEKLQKQIIEQNLKSAQLELQLNDYKNENNSLKQLARIQQNRIEEHEKDLDSLGKLTMTQAKDIRLYQQEIDRIQQEEEKELVYSSNSQDSLNSPWKRLYGLLLRNLILIYEMTGDKLKDTDTHDTVDDLLKMLKDASDSSDIDVQKAVDCLDAVTRLLELCSLYEGGVNANMRLAAYNM
ncbi:unnamed protein product [Ambrosiozyma monospora]|uniref:Unnamed protein product n=1 Tax=Ambrosiozyma monospora TaxID=43982 RepID=A0ACB5TAE0_AMBMO|nr:unnamed protein product [Ambrosiozyma monospora]